MKASGTTTWQMELDVSSTTMETSTKENGLMTRLTEKESTTTKTDLSTTEILSKINKKETDVKLGRTGLSTKANI